MTNSITITAIVGITCESTAFDRPEVVLDGFLERVIVPTEPVKVSGCELREIPEVRVGPSGVGIGEGGSGSESQLLVRRAARELGGTPLEVDTGYGETTRESDLGDILNSRVEVLEGAVSIDIYEEVRWFDGVASSTGASEIVCSRHW